jgi:hypothetical protein
VPITRYLKGTFYDLARAILKEEEKMARRVRKIDAGWIGRFLDKLRLKNSLLYVMGFLTATKMFFRHARVSRVPKGKGITKLYHAIAGSLEILVGCKPHNACGRHARTQGVLEVLVLPLEDLSNIETDRLQRCPSAFAYYDPETDKVHAVPFCSWNTLHRKETLRRIAEYYETPRPDGDSGTLTDRRMQGQPLHPVAVKDQAEEVPE